MSEFKNKLITTKGLELLSSALSGGKLEFTRIVMGSGTPSEDVGNIEALVTLQQDLPIAKIIRKGSQVTLSATLTNEEIKSEYDWTEIGVYAKGADETEVLYMYGYTENSSFISKDSLNEKLINITVMVSNVSEVTAVIDSSVVYLTREALDDHNNDENAHPSIKEWVNKLVGGIKLTWEGITGKPDAFPPASHEHKASEISGLPTSLPASGGNADTVDGKHASDFAPNGYGLGQACATISGGDWNNAIDTGFYMGNNLKNAPNTDWWMGYVIKHAESYVVQVVNNFNNTHQWKQRFKTNGTWTAWEDFGGNGGDFVGKTLYLASGKLSEGQTYTFSNSKGGVLRLTSMVAQGKIVVDGKTLLENIRFDEILTVLGENGESELYIPFNSTVSLTVTVASPTNPPRYKVAAYVNK